MSYAWTYDDGYSCMECGYSNSLIIVCERNQWIDWGRWLMAVWGIGAYYKGSNSSDKTAEFLNDGCAYIGWDETEVSALYWMFDSIKIGDIVYIKSFVPKTKQLHIKAIGIVTSTEKKTSNSLGIGIPVQWKQNFTAYYYFCNASNL